MNKCDRCSTETSSTTMSKFNIDMICTTCHTSEQAHPDYQRARDIEAEEVRKGNMNFPGIGLPKDLDPTTPEFIEKEIRKKISIEIEGTLKDVMENCVCLGRDAYGEYIDKMVKVVQHKIINR